MGDPNEIQTDNVDLEKFEDRGEPKEVAEMSLVKRVDPATTISTAVAQGVDKDYLETLKGLFELQLRDEANEAKKAYVKNMAAFKSNPPEILKTKHVSYVNSKNQTVEWNHAVLGEVAEAIIRGMAPHGLYHMWELDQSEPGTVKTTCIVTHELGHSEKVSMSGPPDTSGGKDTLKAMASTNTLLQRLTLLAVTGLAAKGMDNENPGNAGGKAEEFITPEQVKKLTKDLKGFQDEGAEFLKWLGVETVDTITAGSQYNQAVQGLKDAKKGAK